MSAYMKIFISFFKIGLFTFGGGYAMMPLFRQELIEKRHYITETEMLDYYSLGQCTPGIIAVNVATFTSYKIKGLGGACVATLAIVFPSLVIIMLLAGMLNIMADNEVVAHAFAGIRLGVIALIINEVVKLLKKTVLTEYHLFVFVSVLLLLLFFNFSAVTAVMIAAGIGVSKYFKERRL
ncbi:MAG: chromate transporter [Alphaproteobacteria bacterium]|nr:chromate transporter [Alphaproteobacteria bacterium]